MSRYLPFYTYIMGRYFLSADVQWEGAFPSIHIQWAGTFLFADVHWAGIFPSTDIQWAGTFLSADV